MSGQKQYSFVADAETVDLINWLKVEFRSPTSAGVFRKALAIAKLSADEGRSYEGIVTIRGKGAPASSGVSVALRA